MLSPLATLVTVLHDVSLRAKVNYPILSTNEAATRSNLIEPVLRALGWNTDDAGMIEPEHSSGGKLRIDYVLKNNVGEVTIGIEAKKLGANIEERTHVAQALVYAFQMKATTFFITDGLNWHCYLSEHFSFSALPAIKIKINSGDLLDNATQLLQFLDAAHSGHGLPDTELKSHALKVAKLKAKLYAIALKRAREQNET